MDVPNVVRPFRPLIATLLALLLVTLAPLAASGPHTGDPSYIEFERVGSIGCSIGADLVWVRDLCSMDPNSQPEFEIPLDPYLNAMVFYLNSGHGPLTKAQLMVTFDEPAEVFEALHGATPLFAVYELDAENAWDSWADPPNLHFTVSADPNAETPQLAYQQQLHVCIALFYNGYEIPTDYHPCP